MPKIIHELDCETEMIRQWSVNANNPGEKLLRWIQYVKAKRYESNILRKFDASIVLSTYDQDILNSLCPEANMVLIPLGVDTDFFEPLAEEEEWPSLAFVGDMNHPPNIDAILFFYDNIYGKIKETLSETKLYIVGRNPTKEIYNLSSDESVTVTGYVEDVRPYLARSSVSIAPFVSGTGIKNKILEAMAMGKAVVSTSIGCRGINVSPNEDIIVADDPKEYADEVIRLLTDSLLRNNMGHNARKSMKTNYSWDKIAEQFDILFNQVVHK
ncbi:MAG: glycosyltransferase [Planctomycetes bacterium]|nr:glycosyltransferase [Planctomycetota bacterium]